MNDAQAVWQMQQWKTFHQIQERKTLKRETWNNRNPYGAHPDDTYDAASCMVEKISEYKKSLNEKKKG